MNNVHTPGNQHLATSSNPQTPQRSHRSSASSSSSSSTIPLSTSPTSSSIPSTSTSTTSKASPPGLTSASTTTSTSNSTSNSTSKRADLTTFDSLQDLLEQAGYKETRVVTPMTSHLLGAVGASGSGSGEIQRRGGGGETVGNDTKKRENEMKSVGRREGKRTALASLTDAVNLDLQQQQQQKQKEMQRDGSEAGMEKKVVKKRSWLSFFWNEAVGGGEGGGGGAQGREIQTSSSDEDDARRASFMDQSQSQEQRQREQQEQWADEEDLDSENIPPSNSARPGSSASPRSNTKTAASGGQRTPQQRRSRPSLKGKGTPSTPVRVALSLRGGSSPSLQGRSPTRMGGGGGKKVNLARVASPYSYSGRTAASLWVGSLRYRKSSNTLEKVGRDAKTVSGGDRRGAADSSNITTSTSNSTPTVASLATSRIKSRPSLIDAFGPIHPSDAGEAEGVSKPFANMTDAERRRVASERSKAREEWRESLSGLKGFLKGGGIKVDDAFGVDPSPSPDIEEAARVDRESDGLLFEGERDGGLNPLVDSPRMPSTPMTTSNSTPTETPTSMTMSIPTVVVTELFSTAAEPITSTDDAVALRNQGCLIPLGLGDWEGAGVGRGMATGEEEGEVRRMRSVEALRAAQRKLMGGGAGGGTLRNVASENDVGGRPRDGPEVTPHMTQEFETQRNVVKEDPAHFGRRGGSGDDGSEPRPKEDSNDSLLSDLLGARTITTFSSEDAPGQTQDRDDGVPSPPSSDDVNPTTTQTFVSPPRRLTHQKSAAPILVLTSPTGQSSPRPLSLADNEFEPKPFSPLAPLRIAGKGSRTAVELRKRMPKGMRGLGAKGTGTGTGKGTGKGEETDSQSAAPTPSGNGNKTSGIEESQRSIPAKEAKEQTGRHAESKKAHQVDVGIVRKESEHDKPEASMVAYPATAPDAPIPTPSPKDVESSSSSTTSPAPAAAAAPSAARRKLSGRASVEALRRNVEGRRGVAVSAVSSSSSTASDGTSHAKPKMEKEQGALSRIQPPQEQSGIKPLPLQRKKPIIVKDLDDPFFSHDFKAGEGDENVNSASESMGQVKSKVGNGQGRASTKSIVTMSRPDNSNSRRESSTSSSTRSRSSTSSSASSGKKVLSIRGAANRSVPSTGANAAPAPAPVATSVGVKESKSQEILKPTQTRPTASTTRLTPGTTTTKRSGTPDAKVDVRGRDRSVTPLGHDRSLGNQAIDTSIPLTDVDSHSDVDLAAQRATRIRSGSLSSSTSGISEGYASSTSSSTSYGRTKEGKGVENLIAQAKGLKMEQFRPHISMMGLECPTSPSPSASASASSVDSNSNHTDDADTQDLASGSSTVRKPTRRGKRGSGKVAAALKAKRRAEEEEAAAAARSEGEDAR